MRRPFLWLAGVIAATLSLAAPVFGGGWAVVTLDDVPAQVVVNQPVTIGFTIRAHGRTPISVDATAAVFYRDGDGARYRFEAKPQGGTGHYVAQVKLPQAGRWRWHIATWMEHAMPDLTVLTVAPLVTEPNTLADALARLPVIGGWFGRVKPRDEMAHNATAGRDLFLAKGCATCHTHAAVSDRAGFSTNVGPNLSQRPFDPDYLRVWLKDPSAVKPKTEMPNLGLNQPEIEALTTFLTAHAQK